MMKNKSLRNPIFGILLIFTCMNAMEEAPARKESSTSYIQTVTQYLKQLFNNGSYDKVSELVDKMAIISVSNAASNLINQYFGNTFHGYALSATANVFLLTLIRMYECYQEGDWSELMNLSKVFPRSYWSQSKLLTIAAQLCSAGAYVGICPTYALNFGLFIKALQYDNALKESIIANLYGALGAASFQIFNSYIHKLPQEMQAAVENKTYEQVKDFTINLNHLFNMTPINTAPIPQ